MLCRDKLKVKSTPTFYFFRNSEQVHMHTGANAGKFEKFILDNLREGEPIRSPDSSMTRQWGTTRARTRLPSR